jgi:hypothetical protein
VTQEQVAFVTMIIQAILALLQFALIGVGLWYTIETRRLRIHSGGQLKTLKQKVSLSYMPAFSIEIFRMDEAIFDPDLSKELDRVKPMYIREWENFVYCCRVINISAKPAKNLTLLLYDHAKDTYSKVKSISVLRGDNSRIFWIIEPRLSRDQINESMNIDYGRPSVTLIDQCLASDTSYALLIFCDINDSIYGVMRGFWFNEDADLMEEYKTQHFYVEP